MLGGRRRLGAVQIVEQLALQIAPCSVVLCLIEKTGLQVGVEFLQTLLEDFQVESILTGRRIRRRGAHQRREHEDERQGQQNTGENPEDDHGVLVVLVAGLGE